MVRAISTYALRSSPQYSLILDPVANNGSLEEYLGAIRRRGQPSAEEFRILRKTFGYLSSTLAFTHKKLIRHKDIKLANILLHKGEVLLADFGIVVDYSYSGITTSTSEPS
jgi:serine/threonine protein kinase